MSRTDTKDEIVRIALRKRDCPQPNVEIIGDAHDHDTLDSDAKWRIRRVSTVAGVETTEWADYAKFSQVWDDRNTIFPAVPTESSNKSDMEVTVVGGPTGAAALEMKQAGLCTGGRFREVTVTDSWTELAPGVFERNVIAIQHEDLSNPVRVKINWPPDATAPVGWVGMKLDFGEERQYDIQDSVTPYARVDDGESPVTLWIEEID